MKVWVIMGNDYPDAVFNNEESANKYVEKQRIETKKIKSAPFIYWRAYEFELEK